MDVDTFFNSASDVVSRPVFPIMSAVVLSQYKDD